MFYCVYIGNSEVSNSARDVHWGVKQASHVQNSRFSLAINNCRLSADSLRVIKFGFIKKTSNIANQIHGFTVDYE